MDDVDAVQAQIARNMLTSGDWVTARLDGVPYLEKAPLIYWAMAGSYEVFGAHDWAARIPIALSAIALALLTAAFATWAFGRRAGLYAGLCIATCIGLFLFTRILIPDVMLTFTIALAMWAFLRALDETSRTRGCGPQSYGGKSWSRAAVEEPDFRGISGGRRARISGGHAPAIRCENMEATASFLRRFDRAGDRGALAHFGHTAQSALFFVHLPVRPGPVSRLSLVFLHQ